MGKDAKLPKGETVWVDYKNADGVTVFILTSKDARDCFYLYELIDDKYVKLGKAKEPPELEAKFNVRERIGIKHG